MKGDSDILFNAFLFISPACEMAEKQINSVADATYSYLRGKRFAILTSKLGLSFLTPSAGPFERLITRITRRFKTKKASKKHSFAGIYQRVYEGLYRK